MTTPVFCCGFECSLGAIGVGPHWAAAVAASLDTVTVRSGSRSLRLNPANQTADATSLASISSTILVWRFYIRFASLPISDAMLSSETNGRCGVAFKNSDSSIYAGNTDTSPVFGASGVSITTGIWYRIDVKVNATANPRLTDVMVNGVACGQNSLSVASATIVGVRLGANNPETCDIYFDDLILSTTSGDYPIGDGYVNHFVPTADGSHNIAGADDFELTLTGTDIRNGDNTAFEMVNDIPLDSSLGDWINLTAPPNSTDYVEVVFGAAPNAVTPVQAPRSVEFLAAFHAAAVQTNNLRIAYRDNNGGTQDDVRNATVGSESILYVRKQYAAIPGGGAWTPTAFNNSRARCYSSDANPDPRLDSLMIEAEFPIKADARLQAASPMGSGISSQIAKLTPSANYFMGVM